MINLQEARQSIGRIATYYPYIGAKVERGPVVGASTTNVFVRFDGDMHPKGVKPDLLEWESTTAHLPVTKESYEP